MAVCKYSHDILSITAKGSALPKKLKTDESKPAPKLDDWLKKWKKKQQKSKETAATTFGGTTDPVCSNTSRIEPLLPEYHLPICLQCVPNLPPSLLPPPPDVLNGLMLEEWG